MVKRSDTRKDFVKSKNSKIICLITLFICVTMLCSCVVSPEFLRKKEQGFYPDASDFPDTKWICREIDMCLYMLDYGEDYIVGNYNVNGKSYRVVASFSSISNSLDFDLVTSTEVSTSEKSDEALHCERISGGKIYTEYIFDKDSKTIVCTVNNYDLDENVSIPDTLTFEKAGEIAKERTARLTAQDMDFYLYMYSDIDCYLKGEISIDGIKNYIHAFEIGNSNYYMLSIENGKINNLISGTSSPLICMYFEKNGDQIIARIDDEQLYTPGLYPDWPTNKYSVIFNVTDL